MLKNYTREVSELTKKYNTKNHRQGEFEGKQAVIEILKNRDKTVNQLSLTQYESLLYYIKLNAPKFRTKISSSMKKATAKKN